MKRAEVPLLRYGELASVKAWLLNTPGLAAVRHPHPQEGWLVVHAGSGKVVAHCPTRYHATLFAAVMADVDWTADEPELDGPQMQRAWSVMASCRAHQWRKSQ